MLKVSLTSAANIFLKETGGLINFRGMEYKIGVHNYDSSDLIRKTKVVNDPGESNPVESKIKALMSPPDNLLFHNKGVNRSHFPHQPDMDERWIMGGGKTQCTINECEKKKLKNAGRHKRR